jgi:ribosomal protein S19
LETSLYNRNFHKKKYFRNSQHNSIKLNFCAPYFWKKTFLFKQSIVFRMGDKKIYNRSSAIPFSFRNVKVRIYSGKKWSSRLINMWSVGFKFGELTWNRRLA